MYRVPSEFIKQKQVLFWFVTLEHVVGAFAGYFLGQILGGAAPVTIVGIALGLAVTTVKVQGLTLYRFVPLALGYAYRKMTNNDTLEPAEKDTATPAGPTGITLLDEEGRPIVFEEN